MSYEEELMLKIYQLCEQLNFNIDLSVQKDIEKYIIYCKSNNIEIDNAVKTIKDKIVKMQVDIKIKELKKQDFYEYAKIQLKRELTYDEAKEMIEQSILDENLKNKIIDDLLKTNSLKEFLGTIQSIINDYILFFDGYVYCKLHDFIRLNPFVACKIHGNNLGIHVAGYDFKPILKYFIKKFGKNARNEFMKTYENAIKDALEKCKPFLQENTNLEGVQALSFQVSKYKELFESCGMVVSKPSLKLAQEIFPEQDPETIMYAYISREDLLDRNSSVKL